MQGKGALALRLMAGKKGPRGYRSPCPEWWVVEVNRRLEQRNITKRRLAKVLTAKGVQVSEGMVIRCLLKDEDKRIPTTELVDAISGVLGMPRPVVVAESIEQAKELEAAVAFSELDAKVLALAAEAVDEGSDGDDRGAVQERNTATVGGGRQRAAAARSKSVRRAP